MNATMTTTMVAGHKTYQVRFAGLVVDQSTHMQDMQYVVECMADMHGVLRRGVPVLDDDSTYRLSDTQPFVLKRLERAAMTAEQRAAAEAADAAEYAYTSQARHDL